MVLSQKLAKQNAFNAYGLPAGQPRRPQSYPGPAGSLQSDKRIFREGTMQAALNLWDDNYFLGQFGQEQGGMAP